MRTIVLNDNSLAIRKKIRCAGIDVCCCAEFVDACWLDFHPNVTDSVHGLGYYGEETKSQEEELARFVAENPDCYYCKDVDEFIEKIKEVGA